MGAADVFHIGNATLDQLLVFFYQRQLPQLFTRLLAATQKRIRQRLVVTKNPGDLGSESGHAGARQRRQVDHVVGLLLRCQGKRIG